MTFALRHICMALLAAISSFAMSLSASAQPGDSWNVERAKLFSEVCMQAAPSFKQFGVLAAKAGFRNVDDVILHEPEVVVSLQSRSDSCACYMTMGAYDPDALTQAIFRKLLSDYPNAWRPSGQRGMINDTYFERAGAEVRLLLIPAVIDGQNWMAARIFAPGRCDV